MGDAAGDPDPSCVVIDEVAGQLLTLLWATADWKSAMAGLILFRAFDIIKPAPLRRLERLPGGLGVMLDDLGAGLYALGTMQLLRMCGVLG
jgi:phosphatidylglycerophosphatase A